MFKVANQQLASHASRHTIFRDAMDIFLFDLVTAIDDKPKPETFFLPGLRWTLLPRARYGDWLCGRGSNIQPSSWEADTPLLSYRRPAPNKLIIC